MNNQEQKPPQYRAHGGQHDHLRPQPVEGNQDAKPASGSWKDKWEDTKVILQSKYHELTNDDLNYSKDREEESVYARVGNRLGKSRQETEKMFNEIYEGSLNNRKKDSIKQKR